MLNKRQQQAQDLARSIGAMQGAFVINPMPLRDDARGLRVQIIQAHCNRVLTTLQDWGWQPVFLSNHPRICNGVFDQMAAIYEIEIERERVPIVDRTIRGEIASEDRKRSDAELEGFRRYLGIGMKK